MRSGLLLGLGAIVLAAAAWWLFDGGLGDERVIESALVTSGVEISDELRATVAGSAEEGDPSQRESLASGPRVAIEFELAVVRSPDEAPLAYVPLEIVPRAEASADDWLTTGEDGRIAVELSAGTDSIEVRVPGFEPAVAAVSPTTRELRLALQPTSGLFGRVLLPDGAPAAGAELTLSVMERVLSYTGNATRSRPQVPVNSRWREKARTTANERGFYYLPFATRTSHVDVQLRASTSSGLARVLDIDLPREAESLADIVLAEPARLLVHVIDLDGRPIAGAAVWSRDGPHPGTTDANGDLALAAPHLPAVLAAGAPGFQLRERRHDGVAVDVGTKVESCDTRVEFVLGPAPGAEVRLVDAETSCPIFIGHGRVRLMRADVVVGESSFEPDRRGRATLRFFDDEHGPDAEPADRAEVRFLKAGYRDDQVFELDPRTYYGGEPIELRLEPVQGYACLRGRVVRAGEPVPEFQIGLEARLREEGLTPRTRQYVRTHSDEHGRFSLRWRDAPDQIVTVFPHWTKWEEFAFLGPMSAEEAVEREHVLELESAVRVPALLRGVVDEGAYCYYVSVLDERGGSDFAVPTTINGAPLSISSDGEARTTLLLPRRRRSRVTIGFRTENRLYPDCSTPADFDPALPASLLVFDVRPLFASVEGRVTGCAPDELARLDVGFVLAGDEQMKVVRPASDGVFAFDGVPRGDGELFLVREAEAGITAEVLARLALTLDGDREGIVLAPDPSSLPEQPSER